MLPNWQTGIVERIEDTAPATRRYWLRLPESERFDFKPGQFVTLDLPIHEQRNKRWRSYSIASAPDGTNLIELLIVRANPSTGGSIHIWDTWTLGTEITLRGPHGVFTQPDLSGGEDLFLICTGTGIAPFRAMAQAWAGSGGLPTRNVHLVFGCRTAADLLYREEMESYAQQLPGFHYHPTLSREQWDGHTGYVHSVYESLCTAHPPAHFMLCGWRAMVDEAKARLLALGYDKKAIHLELYG